MNPKQGGYGIMPTKIDEAVRKSVLESLPKEPIICSAAPETGRYKRQLLNAHLRAAKRITPENAHLFAEFSASVLRLLQQADNPVIDLLSKQQQRGS